MSGFLGPSLSSMSLDPLLSLTKGLLLGLTREKERKRDDGGCMGVGGGVNCVFCL